MKILYTNKRCIVLTDEGKEKAVINTVDPQPIEEMERTLASVLSDTVQETQDVRFEDGEV